MCALPLTLYFNHITRKILSPSFLDFFKWSPPFSFWHPKKVWCTLMFWGLFQKDRFETESFLEMYQASFFEDNLLWKAQGLTKNVLISGGISGDRNGEKTGVESNSEGVDTAIKVHTRLYPLFCKPPMCACLMQLYRCLWQRIWLGCDFCYRKQ